MCGIAGIFAVDGVVGPDARSSVEDMTMALVHRGPDGGGVFAHSHAVLGHRRLAIIDRAGGHQPMSTEDGSCWITFNGEIYNHRALRAVLEARGHRFRTTSDTEALLHAYEEYGVGCLDRLEGMFAFAIYDARRRTLFAARDRVGKKPFFYTIQGGALHFASELPALARAAGWAGEIDLSALEGYLSLGYFIAPSTIFRNVYKLPPGHYLEARSGRVHVRQYWDVEEFDSETRSGAALLPVVDDAIRSAVKERLESEVPLGVFLSGGIDSGLVVSYMAEAPGNRVVTASVGFGERAHNELDAAGVTASHFSTQHHAEVIEPRLDEVIGPVARGLGEPLADSSAVPTWYVSRAAKRHVTVALSGDGGDESFAGYDFRYVPHAAEARIRRCLPGDMRSAATWLGHRWPRRNLPRFLRLATILENLGRDPAGAYYADLAFLRPDETHRLMGIARGNDITNSPVYEAVTQPYRRCPSRDAVQRAAYADLKVYLPNDPLVKVDRMSMAHSLEVRSPLLDRRVVELAFRIPAREKQRLWHGKVVLRALARRRLPGRLWELPKRGFTAPIGEWIAGPYAGRFRDEVIHPGAAISSVIDVRDAQRRFDEHRRGVRDHGYALWALWVLERWLQAQKQRSHSRHELSAVAGARGAAT